MLFGKSYFGDQLLKETSNAQLPDKPRLEEQKSLTEAEKLQEALKQAVANKHKNR